MRSHVATQAAVRGGDGPGPHRVFRLRDPDHEDQLGEEKRPDEVLVDAVQVGAERLRQRQEHEGHQQGGQRQGHGSVGDDLQGQDLSVLRAGWLEAGEHVRAVALMELLHDQDTFNILLLRAGTSVTTPWLSAGCKNPEQKPDE